MIICFVVFFITHLISSSTWKEILQNITELPESVTLSKSIIVETVHLVFYGLLLFVIQSSRLTHCLHRHHELKRIILQNIHVQDIDKVNINWNRISIEEDDISSSFQHLCSRTLLFIVNLILTIYFIYIPLINSIKGIFIVSSLWWWIWFDVIFQAIHIVSLILDVATIYYFVVSVRALNQNDWKLNSFLQCLKAFSLFTFCLSVGWSNWVREWKDRKKKSRRDFVFFDLIVMLIIFDGSFSFPMQMINGETNDSQFSNIYLENIIEQLEISDGLQATSCVRSVFQRFSARILSSSDFSSKWSRNFSRQHSTNESNPPMMKWKNSVTLKISISSVHWMNFDKFEKTLKMKVRSTIKAEKRWGCYFFSRTNEWRTMQLAEQCLRKRTESLIKEHHRQIDIQQTIEMLSPAFSAQRKPFAIHRLI